MLYLNNDSKNGFNVLTQRLYFPFIAFARANWPERSEKLQSCYHQLIVLRKILSSDSEYHSSALPSLLTLRSNYISR